MSRTFVVELGAWSIKLAVAVPGLRGGTITHVVERPLPPGEAPPAERAAFVLEELVKQLGLGQDAMYLAMRGDQLFTQVLELPFRGLRRAELEKAVGGELESVVPVDLEDMVFSFEPLPAEPPPAIEGAPVAAKEPAGLRVLTYSLRRDRAEAMLAVGQRLGFEPRGLLPAAGGAARLVARSGLGEELGTKTVAVIDLGHERTEVVLVRDGHAVFSRSLARGGRQLTDAIARAWRLTAFDAEQVKHNDGFVGSAVEPPTSEAASRLHAVLSVELAALVRDLRQTFIGARTRVGAEPVAVVLVGGGSRLRGLASFLGEKLGMMVRTLSEAELSALAGPKLTSRNGVDAAAVTLGLLHDALSGRPAFNLRQGALAVKVDLSFLRAKLWAVGAAAVAVATFAAGSAYANMYRLRKAEKVLAQRLADDTMRHFNRKMTADEVLSAPQASGGSQLSPMPKLTAYDLLLDISAQVPPKDKITLDLFRIDISGSKVDLEGTAKKAEEIDLFQGELKKKIACFEEVSRGTTESDVNGLQRFKINIKSNCM